MTGSLSDSKEERERPGSEERRGLVDFLRNNFITIGILIYVLSPLDFLPEFFLPVIGESDDLILVLFELYRRWREYKKGKE